MTTEYEVDRLVGSDQPPSPGWSTASARCPCLPSRDVAITSIRVSSTA